MADNDQNDSQNQGGDAPKTAKQLLAQIDAQLAKKGLESVKAKALEIKTRISEAQRTIRLAEAELADLVGKFEAGLL